MQDIKNKKIFIFIETQKVIFARIKSGTYLSIQKICLTIADKTFEALGNVEKRVMKCNEYLQKLNKQIDEKENEERKMQEKIDRTKKIQGQEQEKSERVQKFHIVKDSV